MLQGAVWRPGIFEGSGSEVTCGLMPFCQSKDVLACTGYSNLVSEVGLLCPCTCALKLLSLSGNSVLCYASASDLLVPLASLFV